MRGNGKAEIMPVPIKFVADPIPIPEGTIKEIELELWM